MACCIISSLTATHQESISPWVVFEDISFTDLELTKETYLNVHGSATFHVLNVTFFPEDTSAWPGELIIKFPELGTILPINGLVS